MMYLWILHQYVKKEFQINLNDFTTNVNMIVVCTSPNYNYKSEVFKVTNEWIEKGFREFERLLKYAAYALYNKDSILKNTGYELWD